MSLNAITKMLGGCPYKSGSLLYTNFSIIEIGGSKYFKDTSGNGRHLLITDYDFGSDYVKGFPIKSKATVSAPAGDATLIAADVNSFWYTSGTPNQLPATCFFQNIGYADKIFCKRRVQIVDSAYDYREVIEPAISELIFYDTSKTGVELGALNAYFAVPTKNSSAKWVSLASGNNANAGTEASPWQTIQYAESQTLTSGTVIYIKDYVSTLSANLILSKTYKYTFIGFSLLTLTSSAGIYPAGAGVSVEGMNLVNSKASGVSITANESFNFKRCFLKSTSSQYDFLIQKPGSTLTEVISASKYSVINTSAQACTTTFDTCLMSTGGLTILSGAAGTVNVLNSRFKTNCVDNRVGASVTLIGNEVQGYLLYENNNTSAFTGAYVLRHNRAYSMTSQTVFISPTLVTDSIITSYSHDIQNNLFKIDTAGLNGYVSRCINSDNYIFKNNVVINNTSSTFTCIAVTSNTSVLTSVLVDNNLILNKSDSGSIVIGSEAGGAYDNKINGAIIRNNAIYGNYFYSGTTAQHAISIFRQKDNNKVYNNHVNGVNIGIAFKSPGFTSTNEAYRNSIVNCVGGIVSKGEKYVNIYNNTVSTTNTTTDGYCICLIDHESGGYATNCKVKNNILVNKSNVLTSYVYYIDGTGSSLVGAEITNNSCYSTNDKICRLASLQTWSQWTTGGYDANSQNSDPNLNANNVPASSITIGLDLGTTYKYGLDVGSDFTQTTVIPKVVTKEQTGTSWQVGAYTL